MPHVDLHGIRHILRVAVLVALIVVVTLGGRADAACGNHVTEPGLGEECDEGASNGAATSCCTATCLLRTAGSLCRNPIGPCDGTETCDGLNGECPPNIYREAGTVCRPAAGGCDVVETCNGFTTGCPANVFLPVGTACRPIAGVCDALEICTGTANCTADGFASSTSVCRVSAGVCDPAEHCSGHAATCPADTLSTSICRAATGECDAAESCPGNAVDCPADAKQTSGTSCSSDGQSCTTDVCDGASVTCQHPLVNAGLVCRPSAGVCDVAEVCNGADPACPGEGFAPAAQECRPATGECDPAEQCTGNAVDCPADAKQPNGTSCSSDGQSCTTDACDGTGGTCQHPLANAGLVCRPSAGGCDVAEICDGADPACPGDGFAPAAQECRPATGECDPAEQCTGSGPTCPADAFEPDGTACNDGMGCIIADVCVAGMCLGESETCGDGVVQSCGEECDDGNTNANDGCAPTCVTEMGLACRPTPEVGCTAPFVPGKAQLTILDKTPDAKDQLRWKWSPGSETPVADFGDPRSTTAYQLCIYDQNGGIVSAHLPPAGACGPKFCWSALGTTGFRYKNKAMVPDGALQLMMKEGVDGKSRIQLKATGSYLGVPLLTGVTLPVRVQLVNTAGKCWEAVYSAPALKQTAQQLRDKAD